jgi:hypothetical protein
MPTAIVPGTSTFAMSTIAGTLSMGALASLITLAFDVWWLGRSKDF